jgi:magnesium-protoporphyrin IX monomethyl ester (oxidative) cyclase
VLLRVALVNTPFAYLDAPSLALMQLRGVLDAGPSRDQVAVTEHYVNVDFAKHFGLGAYNYIANSPDILCTGLGDWIFRRAAFPAEPDNTSEYLETYRDRFPAAVVDTYWRHVLKVRETVDRFIEAAIDRHELASADVVGFSSMFAQSVPVIAFARALKRRRGDVLTVMGGANCETPMGERLARCVDCLDYVFSGPALVSFPAFIANVLRGDLAACSAIDGVFPGPLRASSRPVGAAAPGSPIVLTMAGQKRPIGAERDVDHAVPLDIEPFLTQLRRHFDRSEIAPRLYFETSRGCWWGEKAHCTFCGLNGTTMHYRAMSPANAVSQFEELFRYASEVTELFAVDNIFPREYFTAVLPQLETPSSLNIFYEIKADVSEEEFRSLARARVLKVQPGIEALSTSTLRLMKKGTTAHQNIEFLKRSARYGVFPTWNILIGFPGESEEVYRKYLDDLPLLVHLPPPNGVYPIRFDRYSPYHMRAAEYGLKLRPMDFYELVYPFPARELEDLAYFFTDESPNAPHAAAVDRWIDRLRAPIHVWRARWDSGQAAERPVLRFTDATSSAVIDTRSGERVVHDVGPAGRALLEFLTRPRSAADAARSLVAFDVDEDGLFDDLVRRGLVFVEGERWISLVESLSSEQALGTRVRYGGTPAQLRRWG